MKTADNKLVPWPASQTDILAEDLLSVIIPHVPLPGGAFIITSMGTSYLAE